MSKRPIENPDRVKWKNDQRQKKMTKLHFKQKLANQKEYLRQLREWRSRDDKRIHELMDKIEKMEEELEQME